MNKWIEHIHQSLQHAMRISLLASLLVLFSAQGKAQQMHFHLVVEHEFAVTNFQHPDFGMVTAGSGWVYLPVDSELAVLFSISATENIPVIATIQSSERLVLDSANAIPIRLEAAYVRDGATNPLLVKPFVDNRASFTLSSRGELIDENFTWLRELQTNVFLYGAVYVGDVEPGVYYGEVTISLEYL